MYVPLKEGGILVRGAEELSNREKRTLVGALRGSKNLFSQKRVLRRIDEWCDIELLDTREDYFLSQVVKSCGPNWDEVIEPGIVNGTDSGQMLYGILLRGVRRTALTRYLLTKVQTESADAEAARKELKYQALRTTSEIIGELHESDAHDRQIGDFWAYFNALSGDLTVLEYISAHGGALLLTMAKYGNGSND